MAKETEVKIRISPNDLEAVRNQLTELGACLVSSRNRETNLLFDLPDQSLKQADCVLRLRTYGHKTTLTFKGIRQNDPLYKNRKELETRVADSQILHQILENLGMRICFEYEKFREIYRVELDGQPVEICLDETPVGVFVEIEGHSDAIQKTAKNLGWSTDQFLTNTYVELYKEKSN